MKYTCFEEWWKIQKINSSRFLTEDIREIAEQAWCASKRSVKSNTLLCFDDFCMDNGTIAFKAGSLYECTISEDAGDYFPYKFSKSELPGEHYLSKEDIDNHFHLRNLWE